MKHKPNAGGRVSWNTSQGRTTGKVKKKLTRLTYVRGHKVVATPNEPQYLVETERSEKVAA